MGRAELKEESLRRILDASALRIRTEGLSGAAISNVMRDAGLTHGAFYAHFANKDALAKESLIHALRDNRQRWIGEPKAEPWSLRLQRLARRYLTKKHRDQPSDGCALAAVATEASRADESFRSTYESELRKSLQQICCGTSHNPDASDKTMSEAIALMSLCIGGLALARAVADTSFSDQILDACVTTAGCIASNPSNE